VSGLLLAVDIGNTNIECGLFKSDKLKSSWRLSSNLPRTSDEVWQLITFFCSEARIDSKSIGSIAIASVVPDHTRTFTQMSGRFLKLEPLIISVDSCPFIKTEYSDPYQIGADRLCNAVGGFHYYGGPLVVVDFGTAITLDVISKDGAYMGGVILPGPQAATASLHRRTSQLPQVSLEFPDTVIGKTTDHGIRSGITWGIVDMIEGLIGRITRQLAEKPTVVSTGGYARRYSAHSSSFGKLHQDLVLDGIRIIFEQYQALCSRS